MLGGYTIVETLIFLAVSGMMFFSAIALIDGRQNRAQFTSAVRDFETQLRDVANNVSSGYFSRPSDFSCKRDPTEPVGYKINPGLDPNSTGDCMLVGTVIKLGSGGVGDNLGQYSFIPMAGLRLTASNKDVASLAEAKPSAINAGIELKNLQYGTRIVCVKVGPSAPCASVDDHAAFGFFSRLRSVEGSKGGSLQTDVITFQDARTTDTVAIAETKVSTPTFAYPSSPTAFSGISVCLEGGRNQHAFVNLGVNGGATTITSEIQNGTCPA